MKNELKVVIARGLPASGKTTYARNWVSIDEANRVRIEKDDIRNESSLFKDGVYNHKRGDESIVIKERDRRIHSALSSGKSVISSDTNLVKKHVSQISAIARKYDAEIEVKDFFDVPLKELIERDSKREHSVGEQVIRRMFHEQVKTLPTFLEFDPALPFVVVSDLDGTLTLGPKNRSPYEWSKVGQDDINLGVAHALDGIRVIDHAKIFIFSGRNSVCRPETEDWLDRNDIEYDLLAMRPQFLEGTNIEDNRSDEVIKAEFIEEYIVGKYNVLLWFDDRARIADMLRDVYGINVAQIGDPNYKF
jgi:predicted kinase